MVGLGAAWRDVSANDSGDGWRGTFGAFRVRLGRAGAVVGLGDLSVPCDGDMARGGLLSLAGWRLESAGSVSVFGHGGGGFARWMDGRVVLC